MELTPNGVLRGRLWGEPIGVLTHGRREYQAAARMEPDELEFG